MNFLRRGIAIAKSDPWKPAAALAVLLVVLPWFLQSGYLFFTDFVWGPHVDVQLAKNGAPFKALLKALGYVLDDDFVQKLALTFSLGMLAAAGAAIAKSQTDDRRVVAVVALFFLCSPFVYDRLGFGQIYMLIGLGFFGLGVASLLALRVDQLRVRLPHRRVVLAGLWFGLALQFSPHYLFLAAAFGVAWLAATAVTRGSGFLRALPASAAVALVLAIGVNLNWLWPSGSPQTVSTAERAAMITSEELDVFATSGDSPRGVIGNVVLLSGFWGKDQQRYPDLVKESPGWGRSFLVLAPIMLLGVIVALRDRRRPLAVVLLLAALASVPLAAGVSHPATKGLTLWLFDHVPFYSGLRETQKWAALLQTCYAVFLAWGTAALLASPRLRHHAALATWLLCAVSALQAPMLYWGMSGTVRSTEYPADWTEADKIVRGASCEGKRVLFLPWHMYMGFDWVGDIVATPAQDLFSCRVRQGTNMEWGGIEDNSGNQEGQVVAEWIRRRGRTDGLTSLGITHVVLAKDADWRLYDWLGNVDGLVPLKETHTLFIYAVTQNQE